MFKKFLYPALIVAALFVTFGGSEVAGAQADDAGPILVKTWATPPVMDQGKDGACVGYGFAAWAMSEPAPDRSWVDPDALYRFAKTLDPWPGEDYDGTSASAGAMALAAWGRLHSFSTTDEYEVMRQWMLRRGPVLLDTPWFRGMMDTRFNGYVSVRGELMGYHLIECYDIRGGSIGCQNSWGDDWGKGGRFRISRPDVERLFAFGAEFVLPTYPPPDPFRPIRAFVH